MLRNMHAAWLFQENRPDSDSSTLRNKAAQHNRLVLHLLRAAASGRSSKKESVAARCLQREQHDSHPSPVMCTTRSSQPRTGSATDTAAPLACRMREMLAPFCRPRHSSRTSTRRQ